MTERNWADRLFRWTIAGVVILWISAVAVLVTREGRAHYSQHCYGLTVAPPNDCGPYRGDTRYNRDKWFARLPDYLPYSGRVPTAAERGELQLEHLVARREAHVSGACGWKLKRWRSFINDPLNMVKALGSVNREKSALDAARWLPDHNRELFAFRAVAVKLKWGLTADPAECDAYREILR